MPSDSALGYLQPVQDSYAKAGPLVASLPSILGSDGPRTYLLAMLNPAEQRYSGGGALSFTTMHFDDGRATFGKSVNVDDLLARGDFQRWKPVPGNIFHKPGPFRVTSSTFSPWWSVSGEELLRGYQATYPGQKLDGVFGLDLQSLADVFRVTGPVDLPHFGTITADNLVRTLAGSYGDFASVDVRHQLNEELVPAFRQKFFEGGQMADKLKAIGQLRRRPALLHLLPRPAARSVRSPAWGCPATWRTPRTTTSGSSPRTSTAARSTTGSTASSPRRWTCTPTAAPRST